MGASIGALGSARAQYHLRQCFIFLDMEPVNQPEIMIANASNRFDEGGNLTDDKTRQLISQLLRNLAKKARDMRRLAQPEDEFERV